MYNFGRLDFPNQHVSYAEKQEVDWYAKCCDYVIEAGIACKADFNVEEKFNILLGNIPREYYRKTLNPYNEKDENLTRFPATMRNYDMMKGIIRRYIGEYIKNPHDFIVGANNPEVVFARDAELGKQIMMLAEQAVAKKIQESYIQFVNEGNNPEQFNPEQAVDIEAFIKEFNENFIDDISAQGQDLINVIDDLTDAFTIYARAYFEFVAFGACYTYRDVVGNQLIKRVVSVRDAFPVPNDNMFAEDYDMFAERRMLTKQQIIDEFYEYLSEKEREALDTYYQYSATTSSDKALLNWDKYMYYFGDICSKFNKDDLQHIKNTNIMARDANNGLFEVWHTVWRGEIKEGILTYSNGAFVTTRIVDETYQLNPAGGDISIEWVWRPQVYESVRIGSRATSIYPYKARPIAYNRNGKLPYNGIAELLPGFGRFSVVDTVIPYQVFRNIVSYHREMAIAKNKMNVLMIAKSLLGKKPAETIYRMAADGVLYIDDEDDANLVKAQNVRYLESRMNNYITELGQLIQEIEQTAKMECDMTPQRYGEIANSAGKGVTDEAVIRGSMGSVIIEFIFDKMRERDYQAEMDYTKLAWIDGLNTSYKTKDDDIRYLSLDVNSHIFANYIVTCKTSVKEREKLEQYKQLAFSAAQNGNMDMANAAIRGDNVAQISKLIDKYQNIQREHELDVERVSQQTEQLRQEFELAKIDRKAEQDRETIRVEKYLDGQIEAMKANANIMSFDNGLSDAEKSQAEERMENARLNIERSKLSLDAQKTSVEAQLKEKELAVKLKESDDKVKIAKTNKNRYDSKSK